jgi:Rab GDP dissociation inhibitor
MRSTFLFLLLSYHDCHSDIVQSRFISITPLYTPITSGRDDNIFITRSYDATSHFETVVDDVKDVYKRVTGNDLVLKKRELEPDQQ